MPDDKPMATLESIAAQLTTVVAKVDAVSSRVDTLATRLDKVDARFDQVDAKIDTSAAETRAQLGVKIEAVEENVKRVYDAVIALQDHHDLRILALEHPKPPRADPRLVRTPNCQLPTPQGDFYARSAARSTRGW